MNQTERIALMERQFDKAQKAATSLVAALEQYEAAQDAFRELADYLDSGMWQRDYEDDEKGLLPQGLKRGVLSQDALWNLLELHSQLEKRIRVIQQ